MYRYVISGCIWFMERGSGGVVGRCVVEGSHLPEGSGPPHPPAPLKD